MKKSSEKTKIMKWLMQLKISNSFRIWFDAFWEEQQKNIW